jgi:hypothetical protein
MRLSSTVAVADHALSWIFYWRFDPKEAKIAEKGAPMPRIWRRDLVHWNGGRNRPIS